ncbi:MAG TPA: sugar-binding transcriptional regulator [Oceanobacillus sp.]|nr:sugar-binding transcriptional regulator [Oceanobacillus sp.]
MQKRQRTLNGTSSYTSRLVQVARAYYLENQIQSQIARSLGISRSLVSRYLTAAREQGIVRIQIVDPEEISYQIGQALKVHFPHLKEVIVAPSFSNESDAVRVMIGRYAANFLIDVLKPGQTLALGCGRTLRAMVDALQRRSLQGSVIVQAMGNIGHEAHNLDYNEIARQAAESLGGRVVYVSAPAILGKGSGKASDLVKANPSLDYALSLAKRADIYMVGIGSIESDQLYARTGVLREEELEDLHSRAVGDICGRFFDIEGQAQIAMFEDRIVGIELEDLRHAEYAIGIAGGADKAASVLGALRSGYINALVSDEQTIQTVLQMIQSEV